MCHKFVALLCCSVQRYRIIHFVIRRKWYLLITTIHTWWRSIYQMLHRIMPTSFLNAVETYHVWLDIGIGILNTIIRTPAWAARFTTTAGLYLLNISSILPQSAISPFINSQYCTFWYTLIQFTETILFQSYVIIVIDIVNANNGSSFHISKQSLYKLLPINPAAPVTNKVLSFKFILSIICEIR